MRLSPKKYPILGKINDYQSLFKFQETGLTQKFFHLESGEEMLKDVANTCDLIIDSKTIDFVSVPFFEKVTDKLIFEKLTHLFCQIDPCEGILLYPRKRFSTIHAVSYALFPDQEKNELLAELHLYSEAGRIVVLYVQIKAETTNWKAITSTSIKKDSKGNEITATQLNDWFTNHIQSCLSILTFKQFAEIEVQEIGGKKYPKRAKVGEEKYLNESDHQINVLDSRWFTETIRGEGFVVSGHFRLQPYGVGMSKRKLIYIDDFLKTGYTRKAKVESAMNN